MPPYAQDILFVAAVGVAFVLLLRGIAKRLDRHRPRITASISSNDATPAPPHPEVRDG